MTVSIGTTTLTTTELGMLLAAHTDLGLATEALGDLYFGYAPSSDDLKAELEAIAQRGTDAEKAIASRALGALGDQARV